MDRATAVPVHAEDWIPPIRPAGGAWSNVRDMARVLMVELAKGKTPEGKVVAKEATFLERRKPMVKAGDRAYYALGLLVAERWGVAEVAHDGATLGFSTMMFFLPDHDLGVIFLTNASTAGPVANAVHRRVFELAFDGKEEAAPNLDFALKRRAENEMKEAAKVNRTPDDAWVKKVAATYVSPVLGPLVVKWEAKHGVVDAKDWKSTFGVLKEEDGTEKIVLLDPPYVGFDFKPGEKDKKRTLSLETEQQKYLFEER